MHEPDGVILLDCAQGTPLEQQNMMARQKMLAKVLAAIIGREIGLLPGGTSKTGNQEGTRAPVIETKG